MVKFTHDKQMELKEIWWIYSEYDFFVKKKYKVFYPRISKDIEKELILDHKNTSARRQFKKEFDRIFEREETIYQQTLAIVASGWSKIENAFINELSKFQPEISLKEIQCHISRYGPGGSYYPPNKVSVRIVKEYDRDIVEANEKIAHEIVHLIVNKLAKKYRLGFENTERLVDLILTETPIARLLINPTTQGFGDKKLDKNFRATYPNIEKALKLFIV